MWNEKIVYIGRKPVMNYVVAVSNVFSHDSFNEVILKARGRAISTAVDVAEVTKRILSKNIESDIKIGTEELPREEGGTRNVSFMEITLTRNTQKEAEKKDLAVSSEVPEKGSTVEPDEPSTVEETAPEEDPEQADDEAELEDEENEEEKNEGDGECG
jgi:DNA-binding protein